MKDVLCPYCGKPTQLASGSEVYPHLSRLYSNWYFLCCDCSAYVGCHKDTKIPFGTPANAELRLLRTQAHKAFDPLWKTGLFKSRRLAYKQLAEYLKIPLKECHIGLFDNYLCNKVLDFAKQSKND